MEKYRKIAGKCLAAVLSAAMALSLAACAGGTGSSESQSQSAKQEAAAEKPAQATGEKIVNVGVTGTVNTLVNFEASFYELKETNSLWGLFAP